MEVIALIGRILFAYMFVASGIAHLTKRAYMSEYASSMGVPSASVMVPLSGVMILGGGVMVALGAFGDLGALLIALFLIPTAFMMHPYWKMDDAQTRQMQQIQFNKNIAMAGGALMAFAYFVCAEGALTLTGSLFG